MSYLVGISGGTASGKTTVLRKLHEAFGPEQATFISMDNYYKPYEEQTEQSERGDINFDHPNAMQFERFQDHLDRLLSGETLEIQEYTFNNPAATPRTIVYKPAPIIILEGILVFHRKAVKDKIDLKVYVDAPEHVRLARRIRRDTTERGYGLEEILDQYLYDAAPMYRKYVEPHKLDCDIILPSHDHLDRGIAVLVNHLKAIA